MNLAPYIKVFLLNQNAKLPVRSTPESIGYDLFSSQSTIVKPHSKNLVNTGISIEMSCEELGEYETIYGRIAPRSSVAYNYHTDIGAGVIDKDYRGEIKVLIFNHSDELFEIKVGDKIAQLIIERALIPPIIQINSYDELEKTERGEAGFGSTGK